MKNLNIDYRFWLSKNRYYSDTELTKEVKIGLKHAKKAGLISSLTGNLKTSKDLIIPIQDKIEGFDGSASVKSSTIGGSRLKHHDVSRLISPQAISKIEKFDLIILQGGSTEPLTKKNRKEFAHFARKHIDAVKENNSEAALYMTHAYVEPHNRYKQNQIEIISETYTKVGNDNAVLVIPVGLAFDLAYRKRPNIKLHDEDGTHPGLLGTYLAACTVFSSIYDMSYSVIERAPINISFLGAKLTMAPPPSSGGTTIATILNIVSQFDFMEMDSAKRAHLIAESMRRAYRDRAFNLGDPDFVDVPIEKLTSIEHARELAQSINLDKATPIHEDDDIDGKFALNEGAHTSHFSVLDKNGNRAAVTQTINTWFGSGYMLPSSGLILNNEMDDFSAKPFTPNRYGLVHGEQNSIEPKKRMLSSMTPTFIESDRGVAILGTPGGSRIITMVLLSIIDYFTGGDAQSMTAAKRFHHQFLPDVIRHEKDAFTNEVKEDLQMKGHKLQEISDYGNMQVVTFDKKTGETESSSDPRGLIEGYEIDFY